MLSVTEMKLSPPQKIFFGSKSLLSAIEKIFSPFEKIYGIIEKIFGLRRASCL
jgi:hypothetical protein